MFLEEDHYVSEDFLPVLNQTEAERVARQPNCDIICLGTYLKSYNYNRDHRTVRFRNARVSSFYYYCYLLLADLLRNDHTCFLP